MQNCGKRPASFPESETGRLQIHATDLNNSDVDSIRIILDDADTSFQKNPAVFPELIAGVHKVVVQSEALAGTTKAVEIFPDQSKELRFWLSGIGPHVNSLAPFFKVTDVYDNSFSLENQRARITLLIFFEHT
ncbi:hypothetical protein BVY01_05010 [bacterium I07]|nr:hypothetical protein BVY01_05010 [bacterium I07]